jgi:tetratricopeptide (TPR) repeat protein
MQDALVKAKAAAHKAIELDANSSEAHVALGYVSLVGDWDWASAQKELSRALELNPNNARAHAVYSLYHWAMGNKEEALVEARKNAELDPLNPSPLTSLGWYYLWTGQDDLAEREFRETLNLNPNTILAHRGLGDIYAHRKLYDQAAMEYFAGLSRSSSDPPEVAKEYLSTYKERGYAAAEQVPPKYELKQAQEAARNKQDAACNFANAYVDLGDRKNALYWIDKAIDDHCRPMMGMKSDPRFDFLRAEPQFHMFLQRMGVEQQK